LESFGIASNGDAKPALDVLSGQNGDSVIVEQDGKLIENHFFQSRNGFFSRGITISISAKSQIV